MLRKHIAYLAEADGIDEPTNSKTVDYKEISGTLKKLIDLFKSVENVPHPGELSTEIKVLEAFADKIKYLKKYDKSGRWS